MVLSATSVSLVAIYFGALLCLLYCLMEFARRPDQKNKNMLVVCGASGVCQLHFGLLLSGDLTGLLGGYPFLVGALPAAVLWVGPFLVRTGYGMLEYVRAKRLPVYHLWPAPLVLVAGFFFGLVSVPDRQLLLEQAYANFDLNAITWVLLAAAIHGISYVVYLILFNRQMHKRFSMPLAKLAISSLLLILLAFITIAVGLFGNQTLLVHIGSNLITGILLIVFVISARYPEFFLDLKSEVPVTFSKKPLSELVDIKALQNQLKELMVKQKLYTTKIKLPELAAELDITPHNLSRLLNEEYKVTFNDFINDFRLEDAKEQLVNDQPKTILEIALDAGFNNKASFNSRFLRATGMTPTKYRKKYAKK